MPESYEEATEERAGEDLGDPEPEPETDANISTDDLKDRFSDVGSRVEEVPDWLKPESSQRDIGDDSRRSEYGIDISLGNLDSLDTAGLLEVLARINVAQLAAMFDIADAVEPFQSITVSGVNAINDAGVPEPVVPESDQQAIPTRSLFMRADENNDNKIYIGDDEVAPNTGLVLAPGEFYVMESDLRAEELYMASDESGQTIQLLGLV